MRAAAHREPYDPGAEQSIDPGALLRDLSQLRRELRTIAEDLRASQRENATLRLELGRLRERRHDGDRHDPGHDAAPAPQRFRHELDEQLERLRRAVMSGRARPQAAPVPTAPPAPGAGDVARLKRMMLFMMMAELA